jgi:hypothetical protein
VDAAFSKVADKLRKTDVETVQKFIDLVDGKMLDNMYDVKSWLSPEIKSLTGVSGPLHYKFCKAATKTDGFYKGAQSNSWIPMEYTILKTIPKNKPKTLAPDYSNIDKERQLKQIENIKHMFENHETWSIWRTFYDNINNKPNTEKTKWILEELPRQTYIEATNSITISEEVDKQINKETVEPKVSWIFIYIA